MDYTQAGNGDEAPAASSEAMKRHASSGVDGRPWAAGWVTTLRNSPTTGRLKPRPDAWPHEPRPHGTTGTQGRGRPGPQSDYNGMMPVADDARDMLDALVRLPAEGDRVTLSTQYLRDIARVEALPENRDGADKTWVLRFAAEMARLHRNVVRTR